MNITSSSACHTPIKQVSPEVMEFHKELCARGQTTDAARVLNEQRLGFVASICPDGTPNLSPKGTTTAWDDEHIIFADICSPGTIVNIEHYPIVAYHRWRSLRPLWRQPCLPVILALA